MQTVNDLDEPVVQRCIGGRDEVQVVFLEGLPDPAGFVVQHGVGVEEERRRVRQRPQEGVDLEDGRVDVGRPEGAPPGRNVSDPEDAHEDDR